MDRRMKTPKPVKKPEGCPDLLWGFVLGKHLHDAAMFKQSGATAFPSFMIGWAKDDHSACDVLTNDIAALVRGMMEASKKITALAVDRWSESPVCAWSSHLAFDRNLATTISAPAMYVDGELSICWPKDSPQPEDAALVKVSVFEWMEDGIPQMSGFAVGMDIDKREYVVGAMAPQIPNGFFTPLKDAWKRISAINN